MFNTGPYGTASILLTENVLLSPHCADHVGLDGAGDALFRGAV